MGLLFFSGEGDVGFLRFEVFDVCIRMFVLFLVWSFLF